MLNIVDAIRKMCEPEEGFVELFDKEKPDTYFKPVESNNQKVLKI